VANATRVNDALRIIAYYNPSDVPPASVQINWTFNDGNLGFQGIGSAMSVGGSTTIDITPSNDPPSVVTSVLSLNYTENDGAVLLDAGLSVQDIDSPTLSISTIQITTAYVLGQDVLAFTNQLGITGTWDNSTGTLTLTGVASVADYQTAMRSITYINNSDNPSTAVRTVEFTVNDGASDSFVATRQIQVNIANDAPILATGSVLNYTENDAATAINTLIAITDVDNATLASAAVSITAGFVIGQDVLAFTNVAMGNIVGSYAAGTGIMTLTSAGNTATTSQWQAALRAVTYSNSSDTPTAAARTVSYTVNDSAAISNTLTSTINVAAVNDTPVISSNGAGATAAVNAVENQFAVTTVTSTDVDGGTAVYTITGGADAGLFTINLSTGILSFIVPPDFEAPADSDLNNVYEVTVQVSDGAGGIDAQTIAVTVTNIAEITVSAISGNTNEAGTTATFTVSLDTAPSADVTINLSSSNSAEGSLSTSSITFTAANWNIPQVVTVTGVDDSIDDGAVGYTIVTSDAASADLNYNGLVVADVAVSNIDDDISVVTVTPISGLVTTEAGGTAQFNVVLTSQPSSDVTINLNSSNIAEGSLSTSSITFTAANWNIAQVVTVTGVDDNSVDGSVGYAIVTSNAVSADLNYNGFVVADISVSNTDNDVAGVTVTPISGLVTTEAGSTAQFNVVLTSQPSSDVTINVSSSNMLEGIVSTSALTFTAANWNIAQVVTVTGVDDSIDDGNVGYTIVTSAVSADLNYNGIVVADVSASNTDNDIAGVTVTPVSGLVTTEAGSTAQFNVVLTSQPISDVTINLSNSNTAEGSLSSSSITFTAANWNIAQVVTITGVDDNTVDGTVGYTIVTSAVSADLNYNGIIVADVSASNTDNDIAGITVTPVSGLVTSEAGSTAQFNVLLTSQPISDVTINLSSSNAAEGSLSSSSITFTAANWNITQVVTITGLDDNTVDGTVGYTIVTSAVSADLNYNGIVVADVAVSNTDNDIAGVTVTPISGLVTTEAGSTAQFNVVLTSQPISDVTINFTASVAGEVSLSNASFTFTAANWNVAQTLTLTGIQDFTNDGDTALTILTSNAISADVNYNGLNVADVTLTNLAIPNVAPVVTTPVFFNAIEDTTLSLGGTKSGISLFDADAGNNQLDVSFSISNGVFSLATTAGLSFSSGDGTADTNMTFRGTIAQINAAIDSLTFTPTANYTGNANLSYIVNDLGNTGNGGALLVSGSIPITIAAVNDAPSFIGTKVANVQEGASVIITSAMLNLSDIDTPNNDLIFTINSASSEGEFIRSGASLRVGDSFSQTDIDNQLIQFNHFGGEAPSVVIALGASERLGLSLPDFTMSFVVSPVNDAPVIDPISAATVSEIALAGAPVTTISASDADNTEGVTFSLTNDALGTFQISSTTGAITVRNAAIIDYEKFAQLTIRIRATDISGAFAERDLTIQVADVAEFVPTSDKGRDSTGTTGNAGGGLGTDNNGTTNTTDQRNGEISSRSDTLISEITAPTKGAASPENDGRRRAAAKVGSNRDNEVWIDISAGTDGSKKQTDFKSKSILLSLFEQQDDSNEATRRRTLNSDSLDYLLSRYRKSNSLNLIPPKVWMADFTVPANAQSMPIQENSIDKSASNKTFSVVIDTIEYGGMALSVGAVAWATRTGGLLAALLSAIPAWKGLDPLLILSPSKANGNKGKEFEEFSDTEIRADEEAVREVIG
jgi:predicted SpoU family rRNA methylase